MSRRTERAGWLRAAACAAALCTAAAAALAADAVQPMAGIGRAPTAAELKAWDIDVRGDFKGLPAGAGSVDLGSKVWEAKCASCHGDFGESNAVFTPIVGGTTKKDIESGRTAALAVGGYPHRTTLMKVSKLSSLWDYIHRAMPWNAPKSLSTDEVYGVLAYILNLGDIVPADFTLSDRNIAEVQKRLPNRDGHVFFASMWDVRAKGDVRNPPCMKDCPLEATQASALPLAARSSNGNIAEQVRPFGPARGTDTAVAVATTPAPVAATTQMKMPASGAACMACHGLDSRIVGPALREVAKKYAGRADALDYLAGKIKNGGSGVWGPIPMPPQAQLSDAEVRALASWLAAGAK